jgi:hypothetical protein
MSTLRSVAPKAALIGGGLALAGAAAVAAYRWGLRPWYEQWGATESEVHGRLPGDELVRAPAIVRTKAITIQAPVEQVWPWLPQIGQGKAGFYSYEFIENRLLGCDIHNSDRIVAEWQNPQIGDPVRMYPPDRQGPPPYVIALVEPNRALVMGHTDESGQWFDTWQFVLRPVDAWRTRLIHRVRAGSMGMWDALQFGYFLMERGMLLGIQARAEALARTSPPTNGRH